MLCKGLGKVLQGIYETHVYESGVQKRKKTTECTQVKMPMLLSAAWFQDKAVLGGMQIDLKFSHLFNVCGTAYDW